LGRILLGVLAFLAVVALAALIAYFLDGYFGWGLTRTVGQLF
jgi:preprotein translocase subunit SecE